MSVKAVAPITFPTRIRESEDGGIEWSIPAEAWAETTTPMRLYVSVEAHPLVGYVSIGEHGVTSQSDGAQITSYGQEVTLSLSEAQWLVERLQVAIWVARKLRGESE